MTRSRGGEFTVYFRMFVTLSMNAINTEIYLFDDKKAKIYQEIILVFLLRNSPQRVRIYNRFYKYFGE